MDPDPHFQTVFDPEPNPEVQNPHYKLKMANKIK
jgi:hypothetical protein